MSRRLRLEKERSKVTKQEEVVVVDKLKVQKEKIFAPLVWVRTGTGIRIEDAKENYYDAILELFRTYYIKEEVLCNNTELANDSESVEGFLKQILVQLKDTHSVIALHEETGELAGVLVLRIINRNDYGRVFSRVKLLQGEAFQKCGAIKAALNMKVDLYAKYNVESVLRYYAICIADKYRRQGLGLALMKCGVLIAKSLHAYVIMGIFSDHRSQEVAKKVGMQTIVEINYIDWLDKEKEMVFDDPGPGNYTCALMAGELPKPPPPPEPPKEEEPPPPPPKSSSKTKK